MTILLRGLLTTLVLALSNTKKVDKVSIIYDEFVNLNALWKVQINSIGIAPINYVQLVTVSPPKVAVEYCRDSFKRLCTSKDKDARFLVKDTPPYYISLEISLKKIELTDSRSYKLRVKYGKIGKREKTLNVYIRQTPTIESLSSATGINLKEGDDFNIVCRINCGFPRGLYRLEVFNSATNRWVEFRTSKDIVIRPESFKPAIMERRIQNEFFARELTKVRCRVNNPVGNANKMLQFKVQGKLDYLNESGPLIIACTVPNPPLPRLSKLVCTRSKNTSWPPIYVSDARYRSNVGLYTTVLKGRQVKYSDRDEGIYTCAVDDGAVKLCTRRLVGDFKNIPKVKILSRIPAHKNQRFFFLCRLPPTYKWTAYSLRGQVQIGTWRESDVRKLSTKTKVSNFNFTIGVACEDMLVTCELSVTAPISLKKTSEVDVPVFCALPGTLRFEPSRFEEPVDLMSKLKAVGLSDPEKSLTYVWDRILPAYQVYTDPGPNLESIGNVLTIPTGLNYRGVKYRYRCFAYKRNGRKSYSSNVIETTFQVAMCSFKPRADILFGIYTNMNPHCSLSDNRYNANETWFELFYKPFISDMLLSLPISANYTRVAIFPITDSKTREPELKEMQRLAIKISDSRMGREHVEQLFRNNIYRLNMTAPHVTSAYSCELRAFTMVENHLSELRSDATRIFLFSLDLYEHHIRKNILFSSIHKDTHSYEMKRLSRDLLSKSDRYFANLLYLSNLTSAAVDEVWMHYGSYCPNENCPHFAIARLIGINRLFPLVPQTSSMFEYSFERQWFPLKKYSTYDPDSVKCFIRTSMPGLRIQRGPFFNRICKTTSSRMDPNIVDVYTVMADNCIWNSHQLSVCTAMLGKPTGKLTISYHTSPPDDGWRNAVVRLKKESWSELYGNIFATATAKIYVPKDRTSLRVSCKVVNKWHEEEKSITYSCTEPKPALPRIEVKPKVITEDEKASVVCLTQNWFVGRLCLKTASGTVNQCKDTESDISANKPSIVYEIAKVKEEMDGERFICTAYNKPINKTEKATLIFRVDRAKVRDPTIDIRTGPRYSDKTVLKKNIQLGYWFTVHCSALVGSIKKMGSSLTLKRYRKGYLDVKFINDAEGCSKEPASLYPDTIFKCKTTRHFSGNSDLMSINVTIKSASPVDHENIYECRARNTMSEKSKNITTKVITKPDIIDFQFVKDNRTILLFCDVACIQKPEVKIKIMEHVGQISAGVTIPLTEIRPGVCRFRYFFTQPVGTNLLALTRCTATADFIGKRMTVHKDLTVFIKPAIFPSPTIEPNPGVINQRFSVNCKFSVLHIRLASSVLLFKKVDFAKSKTNLPCMVRTQTYQTVTGIWKKRQASVVVSGKFIKFQIENARIKDAGNYLCMAFYDSGDSARTMEGVLSKVLARPTVNGIYFYGDGSGDNQVQSEKTKVLLGCQVNVGNKDDALSAKVEFKAKGVTVNSGLVKSIAKQPDNTTLWTFYVIKASISYRFHNSTFSCQASDKTGVSSRSKRVLYVRFYPIHHKILPENSRISVGETLSCSADGYPEVTYLWLWSQGKSRITFVGPNLPVSKLPRGTVSVVCSAQNAGKPSISLKHKSVIVDDGALFFMAVEPKHPVLGKRFSLECPFFTMEPSSMIEWFRKDDDDDIFIAEWTPTTFRLASALETRNISVDMGEKGPRLVFSKAQLGDSGAYRCRYQDASAGGFLSMSAIDALSAERLCVRSSPSCRINLKPPKLCYTEREKVSVLTQLRAELDGCHENKASAAERYFVLLMQRSDARSKNRAFLFSRSFSVRRSANTQVDIQLSHELDQQRLFCAVADFARTSDDAESALLPFESPGSRVELCVRHAARNATISRFAGNATTGVQLRCVAQGNPEPKMRLSVSSPAGLNRTARGLQMAEMILPRGTRGEVFLECEAWNEVAGKKHVFYTAEAVQLGVDLATSGNKSRAKQISVIFFITVGSLLAVAGIGLGVFWKVRKLKFSRLTATILPEEIEESE